MLIWIKSQVTVLASLLMVTTAALLFMWIDSLISIDHARQEQSYQGKRADLLRELLVATAGVSRSELARVANEKFLGNHIVRVESAFIQIDDVILRFNGESLERIEFLQEP